MQDILFYPALHLAAVLAQADDLPFSDVKPMGLAVVVLTASAVVFVIGLFGNLVAFGNKFVNALVTAIIFAVVFIAVIYGLGASALTGAEGQDLANFYLSAAAIGAAVVFVADLIGNLITFNNRFTNALATAAVFAAMFAGALYFVLFA